MTPEEFQALRTEAANFLEAVQDLAGFADERRKLQPPTASLELPMWSIRRLATDPGAFVPDDLLPDGPETGSPGTGVIVRWAKENSEDLPRPEYEDLEQLGSYVARVEKFARRFLLGTQWGARAVHEALRKDDAPIALPRPAPEPLIYVGFIRPSELEHLKRLAPKKELGAAGRPQTWSHAAAAVEARLAGEAVKRRDAVARARRWLNAAVNRKLATPQSPVDPLEPSDDPLYEQKVNERIKERVKQARSPT